MPVVRPYPIGEVSPQPLPNAQPNVPAAGDVALFGGNQAQDLQLAGQRLGQASDNVFSLYERMAKDANDSRVQDLNNQFLNARRDILRTAPNAYYNQKGAGAISGAGAVTGKLKTIGGAGLRPGRQRLPAAEAAPDPRRASRRLGRRHEGLRRRAAAGLRPGCGGGRDRDLAGRRDRRSSQHAQRSDARRRCRASVQQGAAARGRRERGAQGRRVGHRRRDRRPPRAQRSVGRGAVPPVQRAARSARPPHARRGGGDAVEHHRGGGLAARPQRHAAHASADRRCNARCRERCKRLHCRAAARRLVERPAARPGRRGRHPPAAGRDRGAPPCADRSEQPGVRRPSGAPARQPGGDRHRRRPQPRRGEGGDRQPLRRSAAPPDDGRPGRRPGRHAAAGDDHEPSHRRAAGCGDGPGQIPNGDLVHISRRSTSPGRNFEVSQPCRLLCHVATQPKNSNVEGQPPSSKLSTWTRTRRSQAWQRYNASRSLAATCFLPPSSQSDNCQ
jgi:hypothetical protein